MTTIIQERLAAIESASLKKGNQDENSDFNFCVMEAAAPTLLQDELAERFEVVEYITNDANSGTPFEAPMRSMLDRIKAKGRTPVLTGPSGAAAGNLAVRANYALITTTLMKDYGAVYADWPAVAYAGASDLKADGVHPGDAYAQRLADKLSQVILDAAPECRAAS